MRTGKIEEKMGIRKSVFGSNSEKRNYEKLCRVWGEEYSIYHNLPFLNIVDLENILNIIPDPPYFEPLEITDVDKSRIKKTSVDFTLCDKNDKPIVSIEFDGMQNGFNIGAKYTPDLKLPFPPSPWRQEIMDLKLKLAVGSGYPFFIVGSTQFSDISTKTKMTMVDAIIGDVLANISTREKINEGFKPSEIGWAEEDFERLSDHEKQDLIQDWVIGIEVEETMRHNPIERIKYDPTSKHYPYSVEYASYPSIAHISEPLERAKAAEKVYLSGAKVTIEGDNGRLYPSTVLFPNFQSAFFIGSSVAETIGYILSKERLEYERAKSKKD
jgi:hypothetical protein